MTTPAQTTPQALRDVAAAYPHEPALIDGATRLTWADLLDRVRIAARALIARGIEPGDRVAMWAPNTHHWVVAALAAHSVGAALVPLNTRYVADEAADVLVRVDAKAIFVAGPFLGRDRAAELRATAPDLKIGTVVVIPVEDDTPTDDSSLSWSALLELADTVSAEAGEERANAVSPDDISDILFTSGTTGRSKGTLVAHRQALGVVRGWVECSTLRAGDRYLMIPPFFHNFGYKAGILACLVTGATIVPQATFDVPAALALIESERITVLTGPPTIYQTILEHPQRDERDLSSLRVAVTGAATVPVVLIERMRDDLEFEVVITAYGLSESAGFGTMCRPDDDAVTIANTCGGPIADFELRLSEAGEVLLRGPNVMLGYLDDPEATAEAIDADGWLHTGDIGIVDERGYLKITDRLKDMYITGGFNVYPAEIEQTLARLDGVAESAVFGVPDERMGEVGKAVVVRKAGSTLTADEVIAFAASKLANFKVPRLVEFRDQLPYSAAGKVLKRELREEKS
ncbi:fatty acid--CoA ligase family protein [Nocardia asteroides NBRC 15531]|uniref:Fatty-acid--CoA ligase n=1 Tax=Nocardia asteroides NBRC 15531 TaxID=1110697 RepID=U5E8E6_NOCAS|nr:FadD3 family acyl-CoA ligase [Nocardia asteroides]TLF65168.1 fatty acid--CoA ligase family protein [Nocardia asteroides NBRC 15531]UGT48091.1 FadD3 family acyl-CoA ligase [Nocardia asteroides]SFM64556.1 Acyl-CoA synthetase (AMP-forming)/AMP-acid ligase II [Nocardia asteroides]VEG32966.1 Long-chain-fatty-acid--CoA ligase [Nocardia asteroides]GAD82743.1 putative fatty-acid--CoA ligase [Nocardia asteroides NBRC 15531]